MRVRELGWSISYTSRGRKTIDIKIILESGASGSFASPAGASTGRLEAPFYPSGGLEEALKVLKDLSKALVGQDFSSQREFDIFLSEYDGTGNYSRIGSAVSLGCSMAFAEAAAREMGVPIFHWLSNGTASSYPMPLGNVLGGGKHARGRSIDIQEVLVFPLNAPSYREGYEALIMVHRRVGELLAERDRGFTGGKNDEGAWTTSLSDDEAIQLVVDAADQVSSETGIKIGVGLDVAASSLYDVELSSYYYSRRNRYLDRDSQIDYIVDLVERFGLAYVEDPVEENDFYGFSKITSLCGDKALIVGDDIFVTNVSRIKLGLEKGSANGIIIKPNQVGDLTKTLEAVREAGLGGMRIVVSHRSGETMYPHLAHVAVASGAALFKCGVVGGERIVKHIEMMRIVEEYGGLRPSYLGL